MTSQVQAPLPLPLPRSSSAHTPVSDQFLNAKAQSSRRATYDQSQFPRSISSLTVVPENHHHAPGTSQSHDISYSTRGPPPAPPSAFHALEAQRRSGRQQNIANGQSGLAERLGPSEKGKEPELKKRRADWVIDLLEASKGAEMWIDTPRVVLMLGDTTPASLAPVLYNPSFADTLLLVGSHRPLPAVDALSSTPEQTIYPTIQSFTLETKTNDTDSHALTVLLAQATAMAQQFRAKSRSPSLGDRTRTESFASAGSNSPPSTPAMRKKVLSGLGISSSGRSSMESTSSDKTPRPVSMYDSSADNTSKSGRSRASTFSRESIFGGLRRNSDTSETKASALDSNGSLFDAIINFVPPMSDFKAERALQSMLHQAVVITTGVMPSLTRQVGKTSGDPTKSLAISLIHVLPRSMPAPLPSVIESFLLSLFPSFQFRCSREIFGSIVTSPVWLSPFVDFSRRSTGAGEGGGGDDVSGVEVLLFGGVRCPHKFLASMHGNGEDEGSRPRAFLPSWSSCMSAPGLLADPQASVRYRSRSASGNAHRTNHHERMHSSPPSLSSASPDSAIRSKTPPQSFSAASPVPANDGQVVHAHARTHTAKASGSLPRSHSVPMAMGPPQTQTRRSKLSVSHTPPLVEPSSPVDGQAQAQAQIPQFPPTPDLDPSISSCASSFALGETGSQGSGAGSNGVNVAVTTTSPRSGGVVGEASGLGIGVGSRRGSEVGEMTTLNSGTGTIGKKRGLKGWFKKSKDKV